MKQNGFLVLLVIIGGLFGLAPSWGILGLFLAASLFITISLGNYLAAVFDGQPTVLSPVLNPVENTLLKWGGCFNTQSMTWQQYSKSLLLFNMFSGIIIFLVLRLQHVLPLNPLGFPGIEPLQAFNIVCGYTTNTDWQSFSGELTMSNLTQMIALTFGMIVGAVSGVAVYIAFIRGLVNKPLGHFYEDIIKTLVYILLPIIMLGSLFFISQGVPQTLVQQVSAHTVEGTTQKIAIGPVASLLSIKLLGTNGGGFFNANSAHPFENPNPLTSFVEIMLELSLPMALIYTFGVWLKDRKQGWLIWGAMMLMFLVAFGACYWFEQAGNPILNHLPGLAASGGSMAVENMEGKEVRFGIINSALFTTASTATSTGAVNNMHDSLTPIAGLVPLADMMLNVIFGGVGVGLMGFLLYGVIAVFLTGLMVGRTPEIFGKKLETPEMILASFLILSHAFLVLIPTAIAVLNGFGTHSISNAGPHGFTQILYAYSSVAADNGSAFAGLNTNTPWYNVSLGAIILVGRYISMIGLLAIASSLLAKPEMGPGVGTLRTNTLTFMTIWVGVIIVVGALTFVPAIVIGPIAEQLSMQTQHLF